LNREKDARQFAQPVILNVNVPLTTNQNTDMQPLFNIDDTISKSKEQIQDLKLQIKQAKTDLRTQKKTLKDKCKGTRGNARKDCLEQLESELQAVEEETNDKIQLSEQEQETLKSQIKDLRKKKTQTKKALTEDRSQYGSLFKRCIKKPREKRSGTNSDAEMSE
jgi:predicted  nucleic acid-binding Zn-ribbon protein